MDENNQIDSRKRKKDVLSKQKPQALKQSVSFSEIATPQSSNRRVPLAEILGCFPLNGSLPTLSASNTSLTRAANCKGSSTQSTKPQPITPNRLPFSDVTNYFPQRLNTSSRASKPTKTSNADVSHITPRVFRCNFHHIGQCVEKCGNCKWRGHQARDCRIPVPREKQRYVVLGKKAEVICYGCGDMGHYKSNCPIVKFQKRMDKYWKGKAHGDSSATTSNINI
ncbi:putative reverse transcriptase domain-containing protein [Tanacetum coccineum]